MQPVMNEVMWKKQQRKGLFLAAVVFVLLYRVNQWNKSVRIYKERILDLRKYCLRKGVSDYEEGQFFTSNILYEQTFVTFYPIGKIGSGSWRSIFALLSGMSNIGDAGQRDIVSHLLRNPKVNVRLKDIQSGEIRRNFTFVFVRDPFDRLASAYYAKFVRNWDSGKGEKKFKIVKDEILRKYRHDGNDLMYPTESEFAQFVMDRYRDDGLVALDSHWIPIWTKQPFCRVKFDFIGKMESFDRDRDYILRQIGAERLISDVANIQVHKGPVDHGNKAELFLSKITAEQIYKLLDIYQRDFEMFGYQREYLKYKHFY